MKILGFLLNNKTEESACVRNMNYCKNRKTEELMSINPIFTVICKPFNMEATIFDHSLFYLYAACLFSI